MLPSQQRCNANRPKRHFAISYRKTPFSGWTCPAACKAGQRTAKTIIPALSAIFISGVQDLTHVQRAGLNPNDLVIQALSGRPIGAATVFVSHSPIRAELAASRGVSLMLSGHTHNGQIWPFNYFVQQLNPYMAGIYDVENMKLILFRGTGTWGPRMRLWRPGEIVKVTLHPTH